VVLSMVCLAVTVSIILWEVWQRSPVRRKLDTARVTLHALPLRTTQVTLAPEEIGRVIPVNDHLQMIRHASGRIAYLPVLRPRPARPPMPPALKALLLTFFTL
jgi:hypothetical protein